MGVRRADQNIGRRVRVEKGDYKGKTGVYVEALKVMHKIEIDGTPRNLRGTSFVFLEDITGDRARDYDIAVAHLSRELNRLGLRPDDEKVVRDLREAQKKEKRR